MIYISNCPSKAYVKYANDKLFQKEVSVKSIARRVNRFSGKNETPSKCVGMVTLSVLLSIQGLAIHPGAGGYDDDAEEENGPKVPAGFGDAVSFQHDAPHDPQKMGQGQATTDPLRPLRHAAEGEHKA